ncbi:peptide-methionine (R)-S-oxide reductase MsrB [Candidatus Nomurabacteria bacterium]|nr:peptide-methionine (R)-S-oxide reductase MsrB [Candidatus Nomurabacteria bacterium]
MPRHITRIFSILGLLIIVYAGVILTYNSVHDEKSQSFHAEITKSEEEWRKILTPEQYHILREEGTEPPFSSPLNENKEKGTYVSADCGEPLFSSDDKFDSGTGWPSFTAPIDPDAVVLVEDWSLGYKRIEVRSKKCGSHLGHVFDDGPEPTGKRYCINGLALKFVAQE